MNPLHQSDLPALDGEQVSALCDGQLDGPELDRLLARCRPGGEAQAQWQRYQLIGDVLRGERAVLPAQAPSAFLQGLHARLQAEAQPVREAVAVTAPLPVRGEAANDMTFRWKMVSGLASVVAVAAIGWNLLAVTAPSQGGGAQLAQESTPAPTAPVVTASTPAAPAPVSRPLVVATPQGAIIRDAALERLLAEHRQHGGMSAFQNSTGFIRNATYDADAR